MPRTAFVDESGLRGKMGKEVKFFASKWVWFTLGLLSSVLVVKPALLGLTEESLLVERPKQINIVAPTDISFRRR